MTLLVLAACVGLALVASGQSLGELAKKEKKRRAENEADVEVIDGEALRANGGRTANPESSSEPGETDETGEPEDEEANPLRQLFPRVESRQSETDSRPRSAAEQKREAGRAELMTVFQSMVTPANRLISTGRLWVSSCERASTPASNCDDLLRQIGALAIDVGNKLDEAHEVARVSMLPAGEVRELRRRFGMDDTLWDQAVTFSRRFRR